MSTKSCSDIQSFFTFAVLKSQDYTHVDHKHPQFHICSSNTSQLACKSWEKAAL